MQCNNRTTEQMAKINYSQQEKDAIASIKPMEVCAINIKRIKASEKEPNLKNYSVEIRQNMPQGSNNSFNLLEHLNTGDSNFTSGSGVRCSWLTIKAVNAVALFGLNSNELDALALDNGASRLFIGMKNPSFKVGADTKVLQLQKVAKMLVPENFDPNKKQGKYYYENVLREAKKAGVDGRYIKGEYANPITGLITAEYIIEKCEVKSSTLIMDATGAVTGMTNDVDRTGKAWQHIEVAEYVEVEASAYQPADVVSQTMPSPIAAL